MTTELSIQVQWKGLDTTFWDTDDKGADLERAIAAAEEYQKDPDVRAVRIINEREEVVWPEPSCDHGYVWNEFCPICHEDYLRHKS